MCTSPILIRNRRLVSLKVKIPNSYIKVPCGVCDECLRKRAKDIYIRSRFEIEKSILNGGVAFMCCLTYGKKSPFLLHNGRKYLVFNKKHCVDFIKRLRVNLDRFFSENYGVSAPDFKYLITSEFGTDPTRSHLPHYHMLINFDKSISYFVFRKMFMKSMTNQKTGLSEFGFIFQCDPLDLRKGGVRYSTKYILKDQTYSEQDSIIKDIILFKTHEVNCKHNIIEFPKNDDELLYNKVIRSTKAYKRDICDNVLPYRHMLQFYMCSNDYGCSAICSRYGENLFTLGVLDIDGFAYSIPKQVIQRLERTQGSEQKDTISKAVFLSQLDDSLSYCEQKGFIDSCKRTKLKEFANCFIQPRFGCLYFVNPNSVSFWNKLSNFKIRNYYELLEEFQFYDDNNFFAMRDDILCCINLSNSPLRLDFRRKLAYRKTTREREEYCKKKYNNPSNY